MHDSSNKSIRSFMPLLLVLFIDSMGLGILFPVLAVAFMNPSSHFLAVDVSTAVRTLDYGLMVSVFMLCWFFGAAVLGDYSDIKGRKHCLLICLAGASTGYFLSFLALVLHSVWLLVLGRVVAGFTAGSQSIAQAAIVDGSSEHTLNKNMGYAVLSICLGFVAGPMIGGIFSDSKLYYLFQLPTPMLIAAILAIINLFLLKIFLSGDQVVNHNKTFNLFKAIYLFIEAFSHKRIRFLCILFLVYIWGWSNYYSFIYVYLVHFYHYTTMQSALFSACMGLGFCLGSGFFTGRLDYISSKKVAVGGMGIVGLCCLALLFIPGQIFLWISAFVIGTAVAVAYPNILTLFSLQVDKAEQGWVMGVNGSMMALSFGISTLATGFLANVNQSLPLWMAFIGMAVSCLLLSLAKLKLTRED